jgi:hypothetical protein
MQKQMTGKLNNAVLQQGLSGLFEPEVARG